MRRAFLLGLVGALAAKAQSLIRLRHPNDRTRRWTLEADTGGSGIASHIIDPPNPRNEETGLRPKSGHCPLDGTKGERFGTMSIEEECEPPSQEFLDEFVKRWGVRATWTCGPTYVPVLRCPHCGILFTDTEVEK